MMQLSWEMETMMRLQQNEPIYLLSFVTRKAKR
jgi:hypothetical protein